MYVTIAEMAAELNCSPRTVARHCRVIEQDGRQITTRVGRPRRLNREEFLAYVYGSRWTDGKDEEN